MKTLAAIATYNEAANIERLVGEILSLGLGLDVLVIDDNSPDGTGRIADRLAAEKACVYVIHRPCKLGLGTATLDAVRYAVERGYDLLVTMDADFSHDPRYIPDILDRAGECDVVIGSRYVQGGGVVNWPFSRRASSFLVNLYCRVVFHLGVHDYSGAYRAYGREVLAKIDPSKIISRGYSFQEEMLVRCAAQGARFAEVPIVFADRARGATKANWKEMIRSSLVLLRLGLWR